MHPYVDISAYIISICLCMPIYCERTSRLENLKVKYRGYDFITNCSYSLRLWLAFADQFIACGKSRDMAHELASQIWLAVLDNLEENEHTFLILKRLAQEGDVSYLKTFHELGT